jgi:hypothetical protein
MHSPSPTPPPTGLPHAQRVGGFLLSARAAARRRLRFSISSALYFFGAPAASDPSATAAVFFFGFLFMGFLCCSLLKQECPKLGIRKPLVIRKPAKPRMRNCINCHRKDNYSRDYVVKNSFHFALSFAVSLSFPYPESVAG